MGVGIPPDAEDLERSCCCEVVVVTVGMRLRSPTREIFRKAVELKNMALYVYYCKKTWQLDD